MRAPDHFELFSPGQTWRTGGGELWCVTELEPATGKVSFLILFSLVKGVVGRHSWFFPKQHKKLNLERLT